MSYGPEERALKFSGAGDVSFGASPLLRASLAAGLNTIVTVSSFTADEDFTGAPVFIFPGAQVDLVPADDGLLGIALAPMGQALAFARTDALDEDVFADLQDEPRRTAPADRAGVTGVGVVLVQRQDQGAKRIG